MKHTRTIHRATSTFLTLLLVASAAHADFTLDGQTGLPLNPTAEFVPKGSAEIGGSYADLGSLKIAGTEVSQEKLYGVRYAGGASDRVEVDFGGERLRSSDPFALGFSALDDYGYSAGVKVLLTHPQTVGKTRGVAVAFGGGYNRAFYRNGYAFLVASKELGRLFGSAPLKAHLGARYDRFSLADAGGPLSKKGSVFAGLEVPIGSTGLEFVGEVASKNNDAGQEKTPYSVGVRYANGRVNADIGWLRQGITGDSGLFAQLGVRFDTKK